MYVLDSEKSYEIKDVLWKFTSFEVFHWKNNNWWDRTRNLDTAWFIKVDCVCLWHSLKHVPGFVEKAEELKAKGVDDILLISGTLYML